MAKLFEAVVLKRWNERDELLHLQATLREETKDRLLDKKLVLPEELHDSLYRDLKRHPELQLLREVDTDSAEDGDIDDGEVTAIKRVHLFLTSAPPIKRRIATSTNREAERSAGRRLVQSVARLEMASAEELGRVQSGYVEPEDFEAEWPTWWASAVGREAVEAADLLWLKTCFTPSAVARGMPASCLTLRSKKPFTRQTIEPVLVAVELIRDEDLTARTLS